MGRLVTSRPVCVPLSPCPRLPALCCPWHSCSAYLSFTDSDDIREPGCLGTLSMCCMPIPHNNCHFWSQCRRVCMGAQHGQRPPKRLASQAGMAASGRHGALGRCALGKHSTPAFPNYLTSRPQNVVRR